VVARPIKFWFGPPLTAVFGRISLSSHQCVRDVFSCSKLASVAHYRYNVLFDAFRFLGRSRPFSTFRLRRFRFFASPIAAAPPSVSLSFRFDRFTRTRHCTASWRLEAIAFFLSNYRRSARDSSHKGATKKARNEKLQYEIDYAPVWPVLLDS